MPAGKSLIATTTRRVGGSCGLDSPPVIAGCQRNGVHAIHDALVVSCGAVGVSQCQVIGQYDSVAYFLATVALALKFLTGMRTIARAIALSVRLDKIRRNTLPPVRPSTGGNAFAHGVNQVGAHGISCID